MLFRSITHCEMRTLRRFAIEAGFEDKLIEDLLKLLLEGVSRGDDEEVLLKEFKKKFL